VQPVKHTKGLSWTAKVSNEGWKNDSCSKLPAVVFCSKGHPKPRDHGKNIIQGQLEGNIQGGVAPQL
jgi:hypothetical protein